MAETISLLASRTGLDAVRAFREEVAPMLRVVWVESSLHEEGVENLLAGKRRRLGLVDSVSFAAMRREGISEAWAYDRHFRDEGFTLVK